MVELSSKQLRGSFVMNKKMAGIANIVGVEVLIRIVMSYDKKVMFQVGVEKNTGKLKKILENIIDTYCFLFARLMK